MLESADAAQLDACVLKEAVRVLLFDRGANAAEFLPRVIGGLVHCGAGPQQQRQQRERHTRGRRADAVKVAEVVEDALTGGATGWATAEEKWGAFVGTAASLRRQNCGAPASARDIAGAAVVALSPLLMFLDCTGEILEEKLIDARSFYARAIYSLLHSYLLGIERKECAAWLRRCDWIAEFSELLRPFLQCEVEPLARELAFHFQKGKKTARREEPQHFFSFLFQLYERYCHDTRVHGWSLPGSEKKESPCLIALGNVALASIAGSLFCSVYGWRESTEREFKVHCVNSFIDFLDRSGGVAHVSAQLLLAEIILHPSVFCVFCETARVAAERSFTSGARALWRREFICDDSLLAFATVCGTRHMLRYIEALICRLVHVVFALLPSCATELWELTVVPCLSTFIRALDTKKEACGQKTSAVLVFLELIYCAHVMYSAVEEWMERCREVCDVFDFAVTSVDKLALWRDELIRETTHYMRRFLTRLFGDACVSEQDLRAWDEVLSVLLKDRCSGYALVREDMKLALAQLMRKERQEELCEYCKKSGMKSIVAILEHISA